MGDQGFLLTVRCRGCCRGSEGRHRVLSHQTPPGNHVNLELGRVPTGGLQQQWGPRAGRM